MSDLKQELIAAFINSNSLIRFADKIKNSMVTLEQLEQDWFDETKNQILSNSLNKLIENATVGVNDLVAFLLIWRADIIKQLKKTKAPIGYELVIVINDYFEKNQLSYLLNAPIMQTRKRPRSESSESDEHTATKRLRIEQNNDLEKSTQSDSDSALRIRRRFFTAVNVVSTESEKNDDSSDEYNDSTTTYISSVSSD
ncbi:MAG: hypothetical protein Q8M40_00695 [Legionella sp.]|nr:hypothetical protein [Legionella sp.]